MTSKVTYLGDLRTSSIHIQSGTETVPELLHPRSDTADAPGGGGGEGAGIRGDQPPMELAEIKDYLEEWLHSLHETLGRAKHATFEGIWQAYHDLTVQTLYVWDREYLSRMPPRRTDQSIFLSVATYRDENCLPTLNGAYQKSKNPRNLFVGLVQQNCHQDCKSGIMDGGGVEDVEPDVDCYKAFCEGPMRAYCGNVRVLNINESESLGPYAARYFASKLWYGEQWFMQTDAHMTFAQDWDDRYVIPTVRGPWLLLIFHSNHRVSHIIGRRRMKKYPHTVRSRCCRLHPLKNPSFHTIPLATRQTWMA